MSLRRTNMYKSLTRVQLLLGCDRDTVIFVGLISIFIGLMIRQPLGVILGAVLFLVVIRLLRMATKRDPMIKEVYIRHITYKDYYPATSRLHRTKKGKEEY